MEVISFFLVNLAYPVAIQNERSLGDSLEANPPLTSHELAKRCLAGISGFRLEYPRQLSDAPLELTFHKLLRAITPSNYAYRYAYVYKT